MTYTDADYVYTDDAGAMRWLRLTATRNRKNGTLWLFGTRGRRGRKCDGWKPS
jgi:hypothetical protein